MSTLKNISLDSYEMWRIIRLSYYVTYHSSSTKSSYQVLCDNPIKVQINNYCYWPMNDKVCQHLGMKWNELLAANSNWDDWYEVLCETFEMQSTYLCKGFNNHFYNIFVDCQEWANLLRGLRYGMGVVWKTYLFLFANSLKSILERKNSIVGKFIKCLVRWALVS